MSDETRQQLQQALDLIKSGQRDRARALLNSIVIADPNNADAWWIMATAVTAPSDMRSALQSVLRIRPDYPNAQQMLDRVNAQLNAVGNSTAAPQPTSTAPPSSASQIGESLDDLFAPLPGGSGSASTSSTPGATGPVYTPPPYTPPPASQKKGRSPILYILIGLVLAMVCLCGGCLVLGGGSLVAVFNNPTFQAVVSTGISMIEAPDKLPADAQNMGTVSPNGKKSAQLDLLERHIWKYQGLSNEAITITVTITSGNVPPYIGLYNSSGGLITRTQTGKSTGRTQVLEVTLPDDGTYSILIGGLAGNSVNYTLELKSASRQ